MLPFFPPGTNPNPPNVGGAPAPNLPQVSMYPPFPLNQAPQFNVPNAANMAMAMAMLNPNPQIAMQFGLNSLAAMQFLGPGVNTQQNMGFPMQALAQNLNMLASLQSASNMVQGLNQLMANNRSLAQVGSVFGVPQPNQGFIQPGFSGAVPQGTNMINNLSQSTTVVTGEMHDHVSGKSLNGSQHSIPPTRLENNNSRQNLGHFSGTQGRGHGTPVSPVREKGQREWREPAHEGNSNKPLVNSKKRRPTITYDEKEIKQWREARKRNFPTASNMKRKLAAKYTGAKHGNDDAELRRQQMKEVLAKQEELGFEAAEVPDHYLVGSKNRNYNSTDRTQNRFNNKRGRHEGQGRFQNRRDLSSHPDNIRNACDMKAREPTLLKKLLSAEIKADKHRLLHAFRFMILNSFFNQWPDKQLEFPSVMVKETVMDGEIMEGNEEEMEKLEGTSILIERESESENESYRKVVSGEEREYESVTGTRELEKCEEKEDEQKPEEGEITD